MATPSKIADRYVQDVWTHAGLSVEARASLRPEWPVGRAVESLAAGGRPLDAIRLLAHSLPKREAVWFACTCCRALLGDGVPLDDEPAIAGAESWVFEPIDRHARAAYAEAEKRGFQTPGGWTGVAAFWSSGSLAPADQPAVPPASYLTGVAAVGAITLAAVVEPVLQMDARYARFLRIGIDIASGGTGRRPDGKPLQ